MELAEINGRGSVTVSYAIEALKGWRDGTLIFQTHANDYPVYFSLNEPIESLTDAKK